ncbi:MAG: small subunit ribosomal protein S20 [Chlamydiales bacterium]|jgi:small subunit ribosomal protein S20
MADEEKKKVKRPTAIKRMIQNETRRLINKSFKSKVHSAVRRFDEALKEGDKDVIGTSLNTVYSYMDKAVKRGIFKQNKVDRTKQRFSVRATAKMS